jgi:hypothetical protein
MADRSQSAAETVGKWEARDEQAQVGPSRAAKQPVDTTEFDASSAEFHVARMEPPPRRKLYTVGNRLDNPK